MKRASDNTRPVLRQYGGTIEHWPPEADAALRQMCALWNKLVEIERAHVAAVRAATAEDPAVQALDADIAVLETERSELIERRRKARKASRSRTSDSATIAARLMQIRDALKPLHARRKPTAQAAREGIKERLKSLSDARNAAVKIARQEAAAGGLYWGNYNEVMQRFETAAHRCRKTGDELQTQWPNGEGTLAVQVMPPVRVQEFILPAPAAESGDQLSAAWLQPLGNGRATVGLNVIGPREGQVQTILNIDYHRPLPVNAEVVYVRITRRRRGRRFTETGPVDAWVHTVTITCRTLEPLPTSKPGLAVGIDVGWRRMPSGLRIAVAAWADGTIEALTMPQALLDRHDAIRATKSRADQATDLMWARLLQDPPGDDAPDFLTEAWRGELARQVVSKKRTSKGLFRLLNAWHKDYRPEQRRLMVDWAWRHHRRLSDLWQFRQRTHRWARELRRVWALSVVKHASRICIEDIDIRQMMKRAKADGTESDMANEHRRLAMIAGCGELLAWLKWKAAEHGAKVHEHAGKSTWHCHSCGVEHKPLKPEDLWHKCRACGTAFEQDINAARNLLGVLISADTPRAAE